MKKIYIILLSIIFILGYTNLSYELIILRQLISFLGSNILITSVIISFILLFLSLGYYLGSTISFKKRNIRKINTRLLILLSFWYIISCHYDIITLFFIGTKTYDMPIFKTFLFSSIWLIFPSIATGFVTSSIARIIHYINKNYTGRFMAIDTLGSVFGSLITTLVLMPVIGVSATVFSLALLSNIAFYLSTRKKNKIKPTLLFLFLTYCSYVLNVYYPSNYYTNLIKDDNISRLQILPVPEEEAKIMIINGSFSSKVAENRDVFFPYIKFINKILSNLPKNKEHKILVLGAGAFTTGIDDTQNQYTYVDIEPKLKEISETHFLNKPLDKNKNFIAQDAYFFMLQNKNKYDVIIVDLYSSRMNIPVSFVTQDFFSLIKKSLEPNGYFMANIITHPSFKNAFSRRVDNTLKSVFTHYLSRQVIGDYNLDDNALANIIYIHHNLSHDNTIYTLDKNAAIYGQNK